MPTAAEWKDWIEEQKNNRRREYINSVGRYTGDYNEERRKTQQYSGRVLLELIQNANDAGHNQSDPVDIKIELTEEYLVIANTGAKFSKAGVESLFISNNSPKQFRSDCIGYKGLGFRSILNWTSSALILSGELSIGFDDEYALEFLEQLREQSADIDTKAQEFQSQGHSKPIATLVAPKWVTDDEISNAALSAAYDRGQQLRSQGYDTVICLALPGNDDHDVVEREIAELSEEFTLFLQHTRRIEIESPNHSVDWHVDRGDEIISIHYGDGTTTRWGIVKEKDEIPENDLGSGQSDSEYEIKLAIPESDAMTDFVNEPLYVFFPTNVSFPFPILAHATFETTDDRNQLVDNAINRFVADRLAHLMARTADDLTTDEARWEALKTVTPKGTVDSTLSEFGDGEGASSFEAMLLEKLQNAQVIPVYDGGFKSPRELKSIEGNFDGLFEFPHFDDVCRYPNDSKLRRTLQELEVESLSETALRSKIERLQGELSVEDLADVIYRLVTNDLITENPPSGLVLDSAGEPIQSASTVFLPSDTELVSLPEWVPQRFMHDELGALLQDRFNETTNRGLRQALDPFQINEYSFSGLISSIVAEVNQRVSEHPDTELEWRQQMLDILWELYTTQEDPVSFPEEPTVRLPTRTTDFAPAVKLYIGEEYPGGQLTEALYQPFAPDSLVASPSKLGIEDEAGEIKRFLLWLGVAEEPRQVELMNPSSEFREHIIQQLSYPAKFGDLRYENSSDPPSAHYKYKFENFSTIDRLDGILEHADPHAIIAMLASSSDKIGTWRRDGDEGATLEVKPKNKQYWRSLYNQSVPAHPVWLLESTAWLPVLNGDLKAPTRCSFSLDIQSLSPLVGYPVIDYDHRLFEEMNISKRAVKIAVQHAGVTTTLEDLSWSAFYRTLLRLPDIDPDGEHAERLYKLMLSKDEEPSGEAVTKFKEEGSMWGQKGNEEGYYPVSNLRFPESESLPSAVIEQYPILTLPTRKSTDKIRSRFNIEPLRIQDISVSDQDVRPYDNAEWFEDDIQRLKPFIYGLRMDTTRESQDRDVIKDLTVELCESYSATAKIDGKEIAIELDPGSYLLWEDTAYLVPEEVPTDISPLRDEDLASIIAEIFANQLELDIRNEIYMLASTRDSEKTFEVLTGGDRELLRDARRRFETPVHEEPEFAPPEIQPSPPATPTESTTGGGSIETAKRPDETVSESVPPVNEDSSNLQVERTVPRTINSRDVSIQRVTTGSSTPRSRGKYHVADGDRAENISMIFEQDQGRYPLKVAHIRGSDSYGCDILSFDTAVRREQFQEELDIDLIDRYIEVKASTADTGTILLKGSQLQTAREHREKFFFYRAYESSANATEYELAILQDPLGKSDALTPQVKIDPFRTDSTDAFELSLEHENSDNGEE
jgi:hypothetical protein